MVALKVIEKLIEPVKGPRPTDSPDVGGERAGVDDGFSSSVDKLWGEYESPPWVLTEQGAFFIWRDVSLFLKRELGFDSFHSGPQWALAQPVSSGVGRGETVHLVGSPPVI